MNKMDLSLSKTIRTYEYIKDGLKSGRWVFGDEISVVEVADELEVSRRPVIDALKKLEAEYFVEIVPQTGCRVKKYSQDEMADHFFDGYGPGGNGSLFGCTKKRRPGGQ